MSKDQRELDSANELAWENGCELDMPYPNLQLLIDEHTTMKQNVNVLIRECQARLHYDDDISIGVVIDNLQYLLKGIE